MVTRPSIFLLVPFSILAIKSASGLLLNELRSVLRKKDSIGYNSEDKKLDVIVEKKYCNDARSCGEVLLC